MSSMQWMRDPTPETSPLKRARLAPDLRPIKHAVALTSDAWPGSTALALERPFAASFVPANRA